MIMNVLSLFDGISCGMAALERAEIPVEKYAAFEINKYAVAVSMKNYPEIVHYGNVFYGDFTKFKGCDLLIGGSPCTYWSVSRKNREITSDGEGFKLFMQYVRALEESCPKYFLYENNYSIHKNIKAEITKRLGVKPIMINSALVSAQHRKRCYWTNIPNVTQPADKGILLKDVIIGDTMTAEPVGVAQRGRYIASGSRSTKCEGGTKQYMEARKDGKSNCLTTVLKDSLVAVPVKIGQIGKYQQDRVYSVYGKSVCLKANGFGNGGKTGLYKIDLSDGDYIIRILTPIEAERLQTLPDNYTEGISDTQRYKCIGNGWTVDVIAHILKELTK